MSDVKAADDIRLMYRTAMLRRRATRRRQSTVLVVMGLVVTVPVLVLVLRSFI